MHMQFRAHWILIILLAVGLVGCPVGRGGGGGGGDDDDAADDCPDGEIEDCDGNCFGEGLLGDIVCDDGTPGPANFNCPEFNYDEGACSQWIDVYSATVLLSYWLDGSYICDVTFDFERNVDQAELPVEPRHFGAVNFAVEATLDQQSSCFWEDLDPDDFPSLIHEVVAVEENLSLYRVDGESWTQVTPDTIELDHESLYTRIWFGESGGADVYLDYGFLF